MRKIILDYKNFGILNSLNLMVFAFRGQGKYEKAEEMIRRILKERKKALGVEYLNILSNVNDLTLVFRD
jgi:hypothetical protein